MVVDGSIVFFVKERKILLSLFHLRPELGLIYHTATNQVLVKIAVLCPEPFNMVNLTLNLLLISFGLIDVNGEVYTAI